MLDTLSTVISIIVAGLIFRLFYERATKMAALAVRLQCRLLPKEIRVLRESEWLAVVDEVEGDAWKLLTAIGFLRMVLPASVSRARAPVRVRAAKIEFLEGVASIRLAMQEVVRETLSSRSTVWMFIIGTATGGAVTVTILVKALSLFTGN